jgi:hypothetical protein
VAGFWVHSITHFSRRKFARQLNLVDILFGLNRVIRIVVLSALGIDSGRMTAHSEVTHLMFVKRGLADKCREQGLSLAISI